ncbi:MAG: hypothetical protein JST16_18240 [Bdellovibrionales bacterium]|nr:hypothetical protein [Bdellovibrionales bacterium]
MSCPFCRPSNARPVPNMREAILDILQHVGLPDFFRENENCYIQIIPPLPKFLNITKRKDRVFLAEDYERIMTHTDPMLIQGACMEFEILEDGRWTPAYAKDATQRRGSYAIEYKDGLRVIHPIRHKRQSHFAARWAERLGLMRYGSGEARHTWTWNARG